MLIRRIIFVATVVMLSVNLAVGYRIYRRDAAAGNTRETLRDLGIMMQAMQKIRTEYVDADKLEPKQLVTDAMNGLFTSLDPHSTYLPKEEMEWLEREEQGEFRGFGFVYNVQPDGLHITEVKPDSPAFRAGLKPEDVLISCNGKSLEGLDGMAAMQALHGKEGEKADLRIRRGGPQGEILDFAIIRATFNV
ncbi:MAG: PDZ domain-containing protein, partial [Victivallales bacterium]|nr:PDZ domain-containing protein [Victivallales bacterium]